MDYNDLKTASRAMGEYNDCSVKAVAVVLGLSYADAHLWLDMSGRQHREGMVLSDILRAIVSYGATIKVNYPYWNDPTRKIKTPITLARYGPKNGRWLVSTRGHVFAYADGVIVDWTKDRLHRIRCAYRIVL
jgi:hypothetical protein